MKGTILNLAVLAAVVFISIFGVALLNSAHHVSHRNCPVAFAFGAVCPDGEKGALTLHHVTGLQTTTQAIVSVVLSLLVAFAVLIVSRESTQKHNRTPYTESRHRLYGDMARVPYRALLYFWLSLHNKHALEASLQGV